jgi:hypothetical protein
MAAARKFLFQPFRAHAGLGPGLEGVQLFRVEHYTRRIDWLVEWLSRSFCHCRCAKDHRRRQKSLRSKGQRCRFAIDLRWEFEDHGDTMKKNAPSPCSTSDSNSISRRKLVARLSLTGVLGMAAALLSSCAGPREPVVRGPARRTGRSVTRRRY